MSNGKENFYNGLGWFFVWLGLCLGIGGCEYLSNKNSYDLRIEQERTRQIEMQVRFPNKGDNND